MQPVSHGGRVYTVSARGIVNCADAATGKPLWSQRLQGDVARYATLKLAAAVLNRGIERYRDKNQGPILARASALGSSGPSAPARCACTAASFTWPRIWASPTTIESRLAATRKRWRRASSSKRQTA